MKMGRDFSTIHNYFGGWLLQIGWLAVEEISSKLMK
jgi:hypothetical protein